MAQLPAQWFPSLFNHRTHCGFFLTRESPVAGAGAGEPRPHPDPLPQGISGAQLHSFGLQCTLNLQELCPGNTASGWASVVV